MHCFKCGTTLPPGVATCPACGAATPYNVTASAPEAFSAKPDSAAPDNTGEEQAPPPVVLAGGETPQVERTVLQQPPQPEVAESQSVERTVLQEPPAQGTPAPQAVVERTVLQQPPQPDKAQSAPAQQPGSPQPAPPSPSLAWQQPQPMQGQQPGPSQPLPGQQAQPWPQPFPGQQSPQGPSQPLPWPQQPQQPMGPQSYPAWQQPQQPWPQPFPGQQPQQGPWQPQPGMPQPMPWPQPPQQGQPWAQPFPGQQPLQQGPWQPQPGMPQPFPGQQAQPAPPQSYPAWQQPGAVQPQQGQAWPQPFPGQPQPGLSQPLPGQPWPQPFPGQPQFQSSPAWQQPQMAIAQPAPVQQAVQTVPAPAAQALSVQQRGLSLERILLLIIVALFIIGGSGLIYYLAAGHPANLHAQATSVAQDFLTAQTRSMSPQDIFNQATSGKPAINDPLSSANGSIWRESSQGNNRCLFTNGAFHAQLPAQATIICFAHSDSLSNFAFQVQMTIANGLEGGILFRVSNSQVNYYAFVVSSDGFYQLFAINGTNPPIALDYAPSPAIKTGLNQSNLLTVIARDNAIYLYINKQYVTTVNDNTYTSGGLGLLAVSGGSPSGDIAFSNAQVWQL